MNPSNLFRRESVETNASDTTPTVTRRSLLGIAGGTVTTTLAGCLSGRTQDSTAPATTASETSLRLPSVVTEGDLPDGRVELTHDGTVTFLNFFATWCKPCQEEMPDLRRLRGEYDRSVLHMVSITPEVDEELVRTFWSRYGGTWPVVMDPALKATEKWNANSYPTNLLFDREGDPATGNDPEVRARSFRELQSLVEPLVEEES